MSRENGGKVGKCGERKERRNFYWLRLNGIFLIMPVWPATLPQELNPRGHREDLPDNLIRSSVDAGPEKRRRRVTAAVRPLVGRMIMTSSQLDVLEAFFRSDIGDAALSFDFPTPRDPGATLTVVFSSPPSWTNPGGDNYDVTLEMEIQP